MVENITSLQDTRVSFFCALTESQLRNRLEPEQGIFIAESPKVILVALSAGYEPIALLCEERHIKGDAAEILNRISPDIPVYTGDRELLSSLTGYTLTRGVLCAMRRPEGTPTLSPFAGIKADLSTILADARRVAVIHGVVDTTNVGAIFRSAAALGIDAVLLTPDSCDPLCRRAVRVSMGSVFLVPWAYLPSAVPGRTLQTLHQMGFSTAAMALDDASIPLSHPCLQQENRLALIMGSEGEGLPKETIHEATYTVRIPMSHHVDSLNVAAAAAVAFWELRIREFE